MFGTRGEGVRRQFVNRKFARGWGYDRATKFSIIAMPVSGQVAMNEIFRKTMNWLHCTRMYLPSWPEIPGHRWPNTRKCWLHCGVGRLSGYDQVATKGHCHQGLWRIEYLNTGRAKTEICKQIGGRPCFYVWNVLLVCKVTCENYLVWL